MLKFLAFSGADLIRNVDERTDRKSIGLHSTFISLDNSNWIAKFSTSGGSRTWNQYIKFLDADVVIPKEEQYIVKNITQLQTEYPMVLEGDILVGCECPAFTYYYSYVVTQLNSQLPEYSEGRYPSIRNPQLDGTVCKHLLSVIIEFFRFS